MTKSVLLGAFALAIGFATTPAIAADTATFGHPVDLSSVRANIKAHNYAAALPELRDLAATHPDADVYNLLGFVLRKTGDYKNSWIYYTKALEMDPNHKGAHEYLGELYVETGNLDKAREQLAVLTRLCPRGCEEREDLEKAIAAKIRN